MNAAEPAKPTSALQGILLWSAAALVLILIGFLGVDPWFYENVSQRINTGNPTSGDVYQTYKLLFNGLRILPYVVFGIVLWLAAMINLGSGWRGAVAAIAGFLTGSIVANILQMAIGRARPNAAESHLTFHAPFSGLWSDLPDGFPSGEAAATMAIAAALCLVLPRLSLLWIAVGLLGPVVRLLPGMHYFSDVVAGALVGMLLARMVGGFVLKMLPPQEAKS